MSENLPNKRTPFKIILIYIIFGFLWILLSDSLLKRIVTDVDTLTQFQIYKDWFYLLVTAGFLYVLIKRIAVGAVTDITEHEKDREDSAESELKKINEELENRLLERTRELRESEERMRLIGDYGTDGFWDWNLLTDEEYMSPSFKKLFGYEDHELPNHADTWRSLVFPDDLERSEQAIYEHLNEDKPYNIQLRFRHKNGSTVWVICRGVALKNEKGEFVRMVGTHINITQQKLAEEALYKLNSQLEQRVLEKTKEVRQSEAYFRQLSESLPLLVWTSRGEDGKCDYLSPQWVEYTGLADDVQLGFDWLEQVHPDDRERTREYWKNHTNKGELFEIEFRIRRYDGVYRWFQTRALPLKDANGKIIKWFGTNVDIDDRKLNEQTMLLLKDLSVKVNKSENLESALKEIIEEFRVLTHWNLGEIWAPDEGENSLHLIKSAFGTDASLGEFSRKSSEISFAFGEGLPGKVWESGQHIWIKDLESDERFLRREIAEKAGIKTAIGIPVLMQDKLIAVLNFFSKKSQVEDERGIRLVTMVAAQIGEFLQRKRAENELKQSQARLQLGISVAKMAIVEIDLQAGNAELSPEAIELFGFPPEKNKITRGELRAMIHPEDRKKVFGLVENAMKPDGERLFEVQHRILRLDGEVRWLNVKEQMFFVKDKDGELFPQKAILVFLDITEAKQMEESLRLSEDRLRMFHHIVSNFELDYREKINEIIRLGTEMFGFESGLLGEVIDNRYKVVQSVSPGNEFENFECDLSGTICDETIKKNKTLNIENVEKTRLYKKSAFIELGIRSYFGVPIEKSNKIFGTLCFVSREKSKNPITNADKEFLKLMGQWVGAELTRNEAEVALRESEERFRILFERSPAGKVIVDLDTSQFVGCNSIATEILGYTSEEIAKYKVADIDTFKSAEESRAISETTRHGGKVQYETINKTKSGGFKNLLVVSTGIQVEGKNYSYSSFLDITEMKKAETELKRERERLEKIAAVSPSVIHSFRASPTNEFSFPFVSSAIYRLYGIEPEELKKDALKAFNLFYVEDRKRIEDSIEVSKQTMQPWNEIWRICHPEKGEVWVEGHSSPVKDDDGGVTWHGVLTDVTERKRQENELAERERLITAIFNTAPSLIVLWDVKTGTVSYVNYTAAQVLGVKPEDILALKKEDLFGRIHRDDLENVWEFIMKLLKTRDGEVLTHEYRYQKPSGEWRVFLSQDTVFERDENGMVVKTLNIIDDITDRKFAERALRESEERFVKAFEANPAAVVFLRLSDAVVIDVNKSFEKMFGFTSDELLGQKAFDLNIMVASREEISRYVREIRNVRNLEVKMRTKSGRDMYTLVSTELIELNGEECLLSIIYDISDRKLAEDELRKTEEKLLQSQKLESVGRLAGGIAHDFNNMLTAINGYSDLTLRQIGSKSPFRHNLEEIRKAGARSAELTQQLLAFSRKQVLKPEITNLNTVINDTSALLKRLIGEDVILQTILRSDINQVKVDPGHLSQVIVNLAVNSRDAMPKGGIITIETNNIYLDRYYAERVMGAKAGDYVVMTVSDTGIGMTDEEKEHIFEPFYTTKEVGKGTGLGLATVYGFVKQSDGYIWVYSEPGNGTSFKIYLPAIIDQVRKNMESSNETSKTGSETILLVEDEDLVRNLNREILESYGYKVIEARNGVEALKIYSEGGIVIDLLMTDVVMPEMGGSELAAKLAAVHPGLKVLFTSGYTDDSVIRHGVTDEGRNFLQKPFSLETLLDKVREILDK
ncbi:MAG: PAS domain S-box protein [Pyrinomonadaceae bacterium]|nr:PAS domain S-box protein [Pyrinomonadaceae bacterium]